MGVTWACPRNEAIQSHQGVRIREVYRGGSLMIALISMVGTKYDCNVGQ